MGATQIVPKCDGKGSCLNTTVPCNTGTCWNNACITCGQSHDNDCCPDGRCAEGLVCIDFGTGKSCLNCGGHMDECCAGDVCNAGLRCHNIRADLGGGRKCSYDPCGAPGQNCCEDNDTGYECASGAACPFSLRCP
jgi:hypothetical protein